MALSLARGMGLGERTAASISSADDFEAAFRQHYARVQTIASRIAASDGEAEELAQEAFLRLHGAPVLLQPQEEIGAWLVRVVTNLALNTVRSRRREQDRLTRVGNMEATNSAYRAAEADPAQIVARNDERQRVRVVLQELSPRARACLVLRHSGLSYAEIARALGIAPGSVGTTLARAEAAFVERWRRCGDAL